MMEEEYITAKELVDSLGIKNHSARRRAYKQIKNMLKALHGDEWEELLFTSNKEKKYVAKIPRDDVEIIKEMLIQMRSEVKKEIIIENGQKKVVERVYNRW